MLGPACRGGRPLAGSERLTKPGPTGSRWDSLWDALPQKRPVLRGLVFFVLCSVSIGSRLPSEQRTQIDSSCVLLASEMLLRAVLCVEGSFKKKQGTEP